MGWNYSGDPTNSQLDEVRFLTGDTDRSRPWTLQDEEINYTIAQYPSNVLLAAAICAESVVAKLKGTMGDKSVGNLSISYNVTTIEMYSATAYRLRQRANIAGVKLTIGGTSRSQKRVLDEDSDRVQPAGKVDGMDRLSPLSADNTGPAGT